MNGESLNITQDNLDKLQTLFPDIFSEGKIDMEKFKATFSDDINFANERYVLNWAGKSDAFKVLQIPTTATLVPCIGEGINDFPELEKSSKSVNPINHGSDNVFIEGENLEVLKVLQKSYYGKVKVVCIDPPYNTGNDSFIYPDSFKENKADYEKRIGDKDEEGYLMKEGLFRKNSKDSGHYHSNWLSMMYPRLFLAKNLLREDGVIFIHIDDNEMHNLRLLMNEIFGEENFVAQIVWQKKYAATNDSKGFSTTHDYIVVYQKSQSFKRNLLPRTEEQDKPYKNDDNDGKGLWRADNILVKSFSPNAVYAIVNPNTGKEYYPTKGSSWRANQETMNIWLSENRIFFGKDGKGAPQLKRYLNEVQQGKVPITWWSYEDAGHNDSANRELGELFNSKTPFDTPKPVKLIKLILQIATSSSENNLVLDFFAGSATTAHSMLELNKEDGGNRKFILVQLPELCEENSEAFKAGYKTIADISKERIRRVINRLNHDSSDSKITIIKDKEQQQLFAEEKNHSNQVNPKNHSSDNGFKVFKLSPSNFKIWRGSEITEENLVQQLDAFTNPVREESKNENMLFELILKAGYLLTDTLRQAQGDGKYYSVNNGELIIALEKMNEKIIGNIISAQPKKVITLDNLFTGNDQLKTNTVLQMRDAGIEFKTI